MTTPKPERACTCHPDDNPPRPCPQKFEYSECMRAALAETREQLEAALAALEPFAAKRLSTETITRDLLYRSPAQGLREAAKLIEDDDCVIKQARAIIALAGKDKT